MIKLIASALMTASLALTVHAALADELVSETRNIDARVARIKLGGVIELSVRQGAAPSLVVSGDKRDIAKVTTTQRGDTLVIDTDDRGVHFGRNRRRLRAELTVPDLNELVSHGVGAADVRGFSGENLRLSLDGAGSINMSGRYRNVDVRLGGVGALTLDAGNTERVDLSLSGAGHFTLKGDSKLLHANLGGVGSLDAKELRTDTVELNVTGTGSASVYASKTANLKLSGLGSATVFGKPANRNSNASGLGSVSWR
jgi:hypothetical protein